MTCHSKKRRKKLKKEGFKEKKYYDFSLVTLCNAASSKRCKVNWRDNGRATRGGYGIAGTPVIAEWFGRGWGGIPYVKYIERTPPTYCCRDCSAALRDGASREPCLGIAR